MKNKLFVIAIAALVLATLAAGSLAYFTDETTTHNVITSGGVTIELLEWADEAKTEPFPAKEGVSGVMPGQSVTKIAEVKNTGAGDAWVRVKITKAIELAAGVNATPDLDLVQLALNTDDWTVDGEYYYYNKSLAPGETTAPLLESVTFSADMGDEYQNAKAHVTLKVEATQTANNGTTALNAHW